MNYRKTFAEWAETTWPTTRVNQIVNILFFGACAFGFIQLSRVSGGLIVTAGAVAFSLITAASCLFLVKHKSFASTNDELPWLGRICLRFFALTVPFTVFFAAAAMDPSGSDASQDYNNYAYVPTTSIENDPVIPAGPKDQVALEREIKIADTLFEKSEYANALVHYESALANFPRSEHALVRAAACNYSYYPYKRQKTIDYATRALYLNSKSTDALYFLAASYNDLKRYDAAISFADSLTTLDPDSAKAWAVLSKTYLGLGLFQASLNAANEHCRLHQNDYVAIYDRAQVLKAMARTEEAQADLERLKKL